MNMSHIGKKNKLSRKFTKRQRFKRGFRRYIAKKHDYGWKAFRHRIEYRNMIWERGSTSYLLFVIILSVIIISINLIGLQPQKYPELYIILIILVIIAFILELWIVGASKRKTQLGDKIKRKKNEQNQG